MLRGTQQVMDFVNSSWMMSGTSVVLIIGAIIAIIA